MTTVDHPTPLARPGRSYVVSLDNRKPRGSGHERTAEILAAARELFLKHGIETVSTRQIAQRVGISQTTLYVYFKSKEEKLVGNTLASGSARGADDRGRAKAQVLWASIHELVALLLAYGLRLGAVGAAHRYPGGHAAHWRAGRTAGS